MQAMFHRLFPAIILRIGCASVIKKPEKPKLPYADPAKDAVQCLRELLVRAELLDVVSAMDEAFAFNMLETYDFPQGITILGRLVAMLWTHFFAHAAGVYGNGNWTAM